MAAWPGTLPQSFRIAGFQIQKAPSTLRSKTDFGPDLVRNRYSAAEEYVKGTMLLTLAQYNILRTFFDDTLYNGALVFTWTHPITGAGSNVRFKSDDPGALILGQAITHDKFLVSMLMEFMI